MTNIIQFWISREDGVYTASGVNVPIVTDGTTFEELQVNIKEAVELYFEGEDLAELGFGAAPSILANFEFTPHLHGSSA
jgi:predicted RNase H-like HicB family nuclease